MAESQRLSLEQSQRLTLAPQQRQALELLQMNNLQLSAQVAAEVEVNPLLSLNQPDEAPNRDQGRGVEAGQEASTRPDWTRYYGKVQASAAKAVQASPGASQDAMTGRSQDSEGFNMVELVAAQQDLRQILLTQAALELSDPIDLELAGEMIDRLDDGGYLTIDLADLADEIECPLEQVEAVRSCLQQIDKPGLFARSLRECLFLQLQDQGRLDAAMIALLNNLPLLASGDLEQLQALCGVDEPQLRALILEIRRLDPKPGQQIEARDAEPIVPDVFLTLRRNGTWQIEINYDTLPRVVIDRDYYREVGRLAKGKDERAFVEDCYRRATTLEKAVDRRIRTLLAVTEEVVRQQDPFFRDRAGQLRGLTMGAVAAKLDLHVSTVSRTVANKFLAAPRGLFAYRTFFGPSIQADGALLSSEAVRQQIRGLIARESPSNVLSDDKLVEMLQNEGISVARRTVAKYRNMLKIPSAAKRRKAHKLGL